MSVNILRQIARNLQTTEFLTIMMDECTDISNEEQVSIIHSLLFVMLTIGNTFL